MRFGIRRVLEGIKVHNLADMNWIEAIEWLASLLTIATYSRGSMRHFDASRATAFPTFAAHAKSIMDRALTSRASPLSGSSKPMSTLPSLHRNHSINNHGCLPIWSFCSPLNGADKHLIPFERIEIEIGQLVGSGWVDCIRIGP